MPCASSAKQAVICQESKKIFDIDLVARYNHGNVNIVAAPFEF